MAESKAKQLSSLRTIDELVDFFDTHDMGDYWEQMSEAEVKVATKRKTSARISTSSKAGKKGVSQKAKSQPSHYRGKK